MKQVVTKGNFDKLLLMKNMSHYKPPVWCIRYDLLNFNRSGISNVNQGSFSFMIKMVLVSEVMMEGLADLHPILLINYHILFEHGI